jgi:hypothetical protein
MRFLHEVGSNDLGFIASGEGRGLRGFCLPWLPFCCCTSVQGRLRTFVSRLNLLLSEVSFFIFCSRHGRWRADLCVGH